MKLKQDPMEYEARTEWIFLNCLTGNDEQREIRRDGWPDLRS